MQPFANPKTFLRAGSLCLLLSLTVTLTSLFLLEAKVSALHQRILDHTHALITAERMRSAMQGYVASERGFLLTADPAFIERLRAADGEFQKYFGELNQWARTANGDLHLAQILAAEKEHQAAVEKIHALRKSRGLNRTLIDTFEKDVLPRRVALQDLVDGLVKYKEAELLRVEEESQTASTWTVAAILFSAGFSILLVGCLSLLFNKNLVRLYATTKESEEKIRALAAELSRSNAELERFASVASHDLRSPLNTIGIYGQLLERRLRELGDDGARKHLSFMLDGATKMRALVDNLLDYARATNGERQLEKIPLASLVEDVRTALRREIDASEARIVFGELPEVWGDRIQLRQVFSNLIGNAIHYRAEAAPVVTITASEEGPNWRISILDNGIGLDMRYADEIFLPFKRLHSYQERPGTGLGLPICRSVVERHGGKIWLKSEKGKGTEFLFTLPKTSIPAVEVDTVSIESRS